MSFFRGGGGGGYLRLEKIFPGAPPPGVACEKKTVPLNWWHLEFFSHGMDFVGQISESFYTTVCHIAHDELFKFFIEFWILCISFGVEERSITREWAN